MDSSATNELPPDMEYDIFGELVPRETSESLSLQPQPEISAPNPDTTAVDPPPFLPDLVTEDQAFLDSLPQYNLDEPFPDFDVPPTEELDAFTFPDVYTNQALDSDSTGAFDESLEKSHFPIPDGLDLDKLFEPFPNQTENTVKSNSAVDSPTVNTAEEQTVTLPTDPGIPQNTPEIPPIGQDATLPSSATAITTSDLEFIDQLYDLNSFLLAQETTSTQTVPLQDAEILSSNLPTEDTSQTCAPDFSYLESILSQSPEIPSGNLPISNTSDSSQTNAADLSYLETVLIQNPVVPSSKIPTSDTSQTNAAGLSYLERLFLQNPELLTDNLLTSDTSQTDAADLSHQETALQPHQTTDPCAESSTPQLASEIAKPVASKTVTRYYGEKPDKSAGTRPNKATRGLTSRTGKINHYNAGEVYEKVPHPFGGQWTTNDGTVFEYNDWGELLKSSFSFRKLQDFIYQHPETDDSKLILYIQRSPADSGNRKKTTDSVLCRFSECPARKHDMHGTIIHGHYRIALDELSFQYGETERNDPMIVAGYVHLYCLERFMDLEDLCKLPHIRVIADCRSLSKEPQGKFHAALTGKEYQISTAFVKACQKDTLRSHPDFANYPQHVEYRDESKRRRVRPKLHSSTLNFFLQKARMEQRHSRVNESDKPSTVAVHMGNLDIYCQARKGIIICQRDAPDPVLGKRQRDGVDDDDNVVETDDDSEEEDNDN